MTQARRIKMAVMLTAIFFMTLLTACGGDDELVIGINDGYAPFGFTEGGQKKGFEVELMQKIAEEAGFKVRLKSLAGGDILRQVKDRKLDAGIAGITIKESRKKTVDFSTAYLQTGQQIAVLKNRNDIHSVKDLAKQTVGAKIGTSGYEYVSKIAGVEEIRAFHTIDEVFQALERGDIDALVYDEPGIEHYVKKHDTVKKIGKRLTSEHYAIALPKGSIYTGRMNNALKTLGENGTFKQLYEKWFGGEPQSLPRE